MANSKRFTRWLCIVSGLLSFCLACGWGNGQGDDPAPWETNVYEGLTILEPVSLQVRADTNRDGVLSPGERAQLVIELRNASRNAATSLAGTLSTSEPGVNIVGDAKIYFGDIAGEARACGAATQGYGGICNLSETLPEIEVLDSVTLPKTIQIELDLEEDNAETYHLTFDLTLEPVAKKLVLGAVEPVGDNNGDGYVSPGETAKFRVPITNVGRNVAQGVVGTVSTSHAGVTLTQGTKLYFGDVAPAATACGALSDGPAGDCDASERLIELQFDTSLAVGTVVQLELALQDAADNAFALTIEVPLRAIDQQLSLGAVTVAYDSNGDGAASPGETIRLKLPLRNNGASRALGVTAAVSSEQPGATILQGAKLHFGNVAGEASACGGTTLAAAGRCDLQDSLLLVQIGPGERVGKTFKLKVVLKDVFANSVEQTFSFTLQPIEQSFRFEPIVVVEDSDDDGIVSPGDTVRLRVSITNTGKTRALGIVGDVSTSRAGINIFYGATLSFGDIEPGAERCGVGAQGPAGDCANKLHFLEINIDANASSGGAIPFELSLVDSFGNRFTEELSVPMD
jgi:hypothetical protein